jgi:eukaryotic-like serine/threonine-protein kinase
MEPSCVPHSARYPRSFLARTLPEYAVMVMPLQTPLPTSDAFSGERARFAELTGGRYVVTGELGRGGMSRVLLAYDRLTRRQVALKVLGDEAGETVEGRERFRREALIAADLKHPNVVECHGFIRRGGQTVAVMEYIPGVPLSERLDSEGTLGVDTVLGILVPLADALAHIHRNGVVHRDIKPANILLREEDQHPFLTDFGIATLRTSEHSRSEVAKKFGTPEYMSPEQALGAWDADHRSDIYSLGLVGYRALSGRLPFTGTSPLAQAAQRAALDAPSVGIAAPHVPRHLVRVIDRCLERNPRRRWKDAASLRDALRRTGGWFSYFNR